MTVFRYDKTLEGLLTAVFDAYSRRSYPDILLSENENPPLFVTEEHTVTTDQEKSARVWHALEKTLPKEVCNMLIMSWLSEEQGVDAKLFEFIRRVFDQKDGKAVATDFSDHNILRLKQLAQKVAHEREHVWQFTRFQKGGDDTYFAPVAPRYNVLPLAVPYFEDRFRDQRWLLYDIKRRYGYYYDLQTVTEITMEDDGHLLSGQLDEKLLAADEKLFQNLWRTYFDSMAIEARINPKLQRQHMPKRFWGLLTEMQ